MFPPDPGPSSSALPRRGRGRCRAVAGPSPSGFEQPLTARRRFLDRHRRPVADRRRARSAGPRCAGRPRPSRAGGSAPRAPRPGADLRHVAQGRRVHGRRPCRLVDRSSRRSTHSHGDVLVSRRLGTSAPPLRPPAPAARSYRRGGRTCAHRHRAGPGRRTSGSRPGAPPRCTAGRRPHRGC